MTNPSDDVVLPVVSANVLARLLGITPKEVYDLTQAGVLVRGHGRQFDLETNVRAYCDWLRREGAKSRDGSDASPA